LGNCDWPSAHHRHEYRFAPACGLGLEAVNFRTLDLNLLRVFAAVMVERNVTRAAAQLSMTQPAVSNALRRLRESMGDELFATVPGGVLPTPHAEAMWPDVRAALDQLSEALDPQDFDPAHDERSFVLSMADATATVLMPAFAGALAAERASAVIAVEPLTSRDPRPQLERGTADLSVGFFPEVAAELAAEGPAANMVLDPLYRCEYVCVMRRGHPLAASDAITLDDYCGAGHVRVNFAGRHRGFVDAALGAAGRSRRIALTVNPFSTAARIVHDSDLLTVLPRSFVAASGFAGGLAVRRMPVPLPPIEVGLLWHRRHERDAAQRWLRRTFTAAALSLGIGTATP
jgi:DNA-binding transcriptional LysR family regulator